ncbi:MAG: hypothetical protein PHN57_04945, partial [Candidatus Omnitrophica bacterium]|nr:hypothetical protein [Candidatus Omnitrophota bacterium]
MKIKIAGLFLLTVLFGSLLCPGAAFCEESQVKKEEYAGEFSAYSVKVPLSNYYVVKGAMLVFGNRWGEPYE